MSSSVIEFPKLYKKTSTGKQQQWSIWVLNNEIHTAWGQTNGVMQKTVDVVKTGKNVGKKNETSAEKQAELEAQALWEKKLKKGYNQTAVAAMAGEVDAIIEGGISPMLAHSYKDHGHKIEWPAYVQPKLDGHRCIAVVEDGKCTLWSRTRKLITGVPHIAAEVERRCADAGINDIVLDGELYNHAYRNKFEELTSFIRQKAPKDGHTVVQYHVYDIVKDASFQARNVHLTALLVDDVYPMSESTVLLVETLAANDEAAMQEAFADFLDKGFEGAMVRNGEGKYVNKRSYDLLKVKEFADAEFEIVGVEEGRGKLAGHAVFVCRNERDQDFRAKMMGETSKLKLYWDNPSLAIGRMLTVKYQGLTADGIPRFPVGVRMREDV